MSFPVDSPSGSGTEPFELDPVFLHSRREAVAIFLLWFFCLLWAVPVSYSMGFNQNVVPGEVPTTLGMPSWVFWGLLLPWLVADAVTIYLCFGFIKNDDLGKAPEESDEGEASSPSGEEASA